MTVTAVAVLTNTNVGVRKFVRVDVLECPIRRQPTTRVEHIEGTHRDLGEHLTFDGGASACHPVLVGHLENGEPVIDFGACGGRTNQMALRRMHVELAALGR